MARNSQATTPASAAPLTLREASEVLGVHYMTAYRYVRTGRLPASKNGSEWAVHPADLERLRRGGSPGRGRVAKSRRVPELVDRLVAGDEGGAWSLVEAVLAGGTSPADVYVDMFVPALRLIGEGWERGEISVADEHCATVVMQRLVGRMGPRFRRRGRPRGIVVLGAPEGEMHALPTALAADMLRGNGFVVVDLGANVPTESFVDCVDRRPRVIAVGIAVTTSQPRSGVRRLIAGLRAVDPMLPIILGGSGIDEPDARRLGADRWADDAPRLLRVLADRPRRTA